MRCCRFLFCCLLACLTANADAQICVEVTNPTDEYREEIIELPLDSVCLWLGTSSDSLRVLDRAGLDVPSQLTPNGKLLIGAYVRKGGKNTYTIRKGATHDFPIFCDGALHPERKDDFAWENDRGAYRVYGPALERTGERSYGIDVWTKNTPELVLNDRYYIEDVVMMPKVDSLRRIDRHRGDSLYRINSYHHDHGKGFDPYKVGATLGCGAPALLMGDSIVMPYCFESYEVITRGPLRFEVCLHQSPRVVCGDTIRETRVIRLDKGSNFNRMEVWYDGLSKPVSLCSGVVVQKEDQESVVLGRNYVAYTDPTDQPDVHHAPLYVAAIFPHGEVEIKRKDGHALGIIPNYQGGHFTYYFGSAWSKYDVRTAEEWNARIGWFLRSIEHPLQVTLKK
ncbi:DUF4861 family protein [Prevotella sp. FD3004]|uniref:DUF4861 family protein n=1 Tax=Prevotella sp. FD3004 TaxID=1408309 RepID=UPI000566A83E|nr:DUF4861 family protein [Prevotella sp. FD3004]